MKITKLETLLTHAGLRNYLFVRLQTDNGLIGIGESSLEWQERSVECLLSDWVLDSVIGTDPFDVEATIGGLIRDQYQGGPTVLSAISGVEIALWDLIGKVCGQPLYKLIGGRAREQLPSYANGWYGGARTPQDYARLAKQVVASGYRAMKFDPFGVAWKSMSHEEMKFAEQTVAAVRESVGDDIELMIEVHGRLSADRAIAMARQLASYRPCWYEEPVTPHDLDLLKEVKQGVTFPIAAGERLYMLEEFGRLCAMRACDIIQPDLVHCGGIGTGKKIAALAQAHDMQLAPHCSVGPVALCAAIHFGWSTPTVMVQENFGDYDVQWRADLVSGWNPGTGGKFSLPEKPGLGIELDESACRAHPPQKNPFPSLWDNKWLEEFTKSGKRES